MRSSFLAPLLATLVATRMLPAAADPAAIDFNPTSTAAAPCGTGAPPRGHFPREIAAVDHPDGITLTVRQDGSRLCYVEGENAEAPVLRMRRGSTLTLHLRNEITDPQAIEDMVQPGKLETPTEALPATDGAYPVEPGHHHAATGATNLHVHGFAVPPVAPQDEVLIGCTDPATGPASCGRRDMVYRYRIPADMPAGLYWYHPHIHGEVQAQLLMGLSGAIVVEGPDDEARRVAGIEDRVFIIRQTQDLDAPAGSDVEPPLPAATGSPQPPAPARRSAAPSTAPMSSAARTTRVSTN
jgi:FtsP/CotA-like multicopper oxidase with cupredoxin domain